jgi:HCOMODA/2-hydroxy-3-carboxy-muconic semialdehyde decarboxylase
MLVRNPRLGQSLAKKLGKYPAVLMRGHGSTCVGENLQRAVGRSVYLELNARMQLQAVMLAGPRGRINFMDAGEVAANISWQNYDRSWNLWRTRALARLKAEARS